MKRKSTKDIQEVVVKHEDLPWAAKNGYVNGDIFEDWLRSTGSDDPHYELKRFFRHRDHLLKQQVLEEAKKAVSEAMK